MLAASCLLSRHTYFATEKRLGIERADVVWAVAENWTADSEELEPSWRVQLGVGSDEDLWEAMDLLLKRMAGKVEVHWVRGHEDERTTRRMMNKHQRGNVRVDANCTAVKSGTRSRIKLLLPRRKSRRLCYDGVEMVGVLRKELRDKTRTERLMKHFRDTREWGAEAERWLGEEVVAGWKMASNALHQRVAAVRMMFSMWLTEDLVARRADHLTDAERTVVTKCALCEEEARCRRNEHPLFECTAPSVVRLRQEVEAAVEKKVNRLVKPGPVREAIMVPWRLDKAGRPPNVGVMAEMEAALGTVLGAEVPAEGYRKLLTRQSTAAETGGGSWAGAGVVRHQVHILEGAGAEAGGAEAAAPGLEEQEEGWEQQAGWSKTARGRRQVLEEDAPAEEAVAEQAGVPEKAQAQPGGDKEAAESYEKR